MSRAASRAVSPAPGQVNQENAIEIITQLRTELREQKRALTDLKAVDNMRNQIQELGAQLRQPILKTRIRGFNGIDKNYTIDQFKIQAKITFLMNPQFESDESKLQFIIAHLEGPALQHIEPHLGELEEDY